MSAYKLREFKSFRFRPDAWYCQVEPTVRRGAQTTLFSVRFNPPNETYGNVSQRRTPKSKLFISLHE